MTSKKIHPFFTVTALSATSSLLRIFLLFILNKVVAVSLGTTGFVLMSNFQNVLSMSQSLGGKSLQPGLIRFFPLAKSQGKTIAGHYWASLWLSLGGALLSALIVLLFKEQLFSHKALTLMPKHLLWILPITLFSASIVTLSIGLLQASERYKEWFYLVNGLLFVQIGITITSVVYREIEGLFGALLIVPILQLGIIASLNARELWATHGKTPSTPLSLIDVKKMSEYLFMGAVSLGLTPLGLILIRQHLIDTVGMDTTGLWQGVVRLSELALMLVTTTFATWYLPQLAKKQGTKEVGATIVGVISIVTLLTAVCGALAWLLRAPLINLVFSSQFLGAQEFFGWQMGLLTLQVLSWALGSVLLIHGRVKEFTALEVAGQLIALLLALLLISEWGVYGVLFAYGVEAVLYCGYLILRLRRELRFGITYHLGRFA